MRQFFSCFFDKDDNSYRRIWSDGVFVFDSNILLNFYRYSEQTKKDFFLIMDRLEQNLWLPHQVAYEYLKNRKKVILEQDKYYSQIFNAVRDGFDKLKKSLEKHRLKKNRHFDMDAFFTQVREHEERLYASIQQAKSGILSLDTEDPVLTKIERMFSGKLGLKFDESKIKSLCEEAEKRYKNKIPPGFKDDEKEKNKYGDFFIWKQMIAYSASNQKSIIFVTDDEKSDWWLKIHEKTIGLYPELIEEFNTETNGQDIIIYNSSNFIRFAQRFLSITVHAESIQEVESVSSIQNENSIQDGLATVQSGESQLGSENVLLEIIEE